MPENSDRALSGGTQMVYATGDSADWPSEQDALAAAPGTHRLLMENDQVRVLDVVIPPGTTEAPHHHQWPSVILLVEMENFVDRTAAGEVIFDTRELPEPFELPAAQWKQSEALHAVENVSTTTPVRLLRVELKR